MKAEEASKAQLIDSLRDVKTTCESAVRVIRTHHQIKSNRIHSLLKKRHELTSAYRRALRHLETEISVTRNSQDYSGAFSRRSSDQSRPASKMSE